MGGAVEQKGIQPFQHALFVALAAEDDVVVYGAAEMEQFPQLGLGGGAGGSFAVDVQHGPAVGAGAVPLFFHGDLSLAPGQKKQS